MESTTSTTNIKPARTALLTSVLLTLAMLVTAWKHNNPVALALAMPISLLVYLIFLSIGTEPVAKRLRTWCGRSLIRHLAIPLGLATFLFFYAILGGSIPPVGNGWQIPLLFCAPALFYWYAQRTETTITWKDTIGVALCILPYALHDYPFNTHLPFGGGGFENLYLTLAIVVAVYSLVVVRSLKDVGFVLFFSRDALKTVLRGWAIFFVIMVATGLPGGLIRWVGYEPITPDLVIAALALFLGTFFGTALPEELLFRGALMNLLLQRVTQTGNWRRYLNGGLLLIPLSIVAGYTIHDKAQWFPALTAAGLWGTTFWLIKREATHASLYTAQLIISIIFGLAHYHMDSTLFMGLAMVAGWLYGHIYRKTGSVFYSALTHALVNTTPALFGLSVVR